MRDNRHSSKSQIEKLVHFFEQNVHQLKSQSFNETQARQQLIDPLFEALGWDVHNRSMKPLYLQEVVPEGRVKTSLSKEVKEQEALFETKSTLVKNYREYASILDYIAEDNYKASSKAAIKKPDYRFRINGKTKFFVEAKKPFVDLSKNVEAIFQVKRYGFSGRVPVSILTDFEEFRTFDCTHKPQFDKPKLGIIKELDLSYPQYVEEFDRLYDTFSREAVEAGSFDTLTRKLLQKKTGDFALDKHFLEDLSRWREELARDIAKHPRNRRRLNDYTLNESVQRILDRIVFFRVCEDREIEVENTLLAILQMWQGRPGISLYSLLNDLFKQRRALYNGLLFAPHECEELEVGNEVLLKILEGLNYPFSPYYFNEIGVEILGSIYEKFLGKTIHLTPKTVRVEEKPEVRKAGGVYYTPQYIVDYIVGNTLGKLLYEDVLSSPSQGEVSRRDGGVEEKANPLRSKKRIASPLEKGTKEGHVLKLSPKQVGKLKIIDIACGSGSFLLGAFQKLIDYHVEWYQSHPKDIQTVNNVPDAYRDTAGNLHLSPRKKRDILLNNIYGVDIDRQAVEVTQMSLYLKVLEGENAETLNPQMTLALKEVYLPSLADNIKCGNSLIGTDFFAQGTLFDEEMQHKVNPFDWETEFKEILSPRGEIPSPRRGLGRGLNDGREVSKNETPSQPSPNRGRGEVGGFDCVIGNPPWVSLSGKFGAELASDEEIEYMVGRFQGNTYMPNLYEFFVCQSLQLLQNGGYASLIVPDRLAFNKQFVRLRERILKSTELCSLYFKMPFPEVIVDTMIYVVHKAERIRTNNLVFVTEQDRFTQNIPQLTFLKTPDFIFKYSANVELASLLDKIESSRHVTRLSNVCKSTSGFGGKSELISPRKIGSTQIKTLKGDSIGRYELRKNYWFEFKKSNITGRTTDLRKLGSRPKVLIRKTGSTLIATFDDSGVFPEQSLYFLYDFMEGINAKFLLALINSRLFNTYYFDRLITNRESIAQLKKIHLDMLPIRTIDFANPTEKQMHDELVALVDQTLELHKQLDKVSFESEKEPIQRQIVATNRKIDEMVYKLYGLTEEEIKLMEQI